MSLLKKSIPVIGLIFTWWFLCLGCQERTETEVFGATIENREYVRVSGIFNHPEDLAGSKVALKGVIDLQDERGYWF